MKKIFLLILIFLITISNGQKLGIVAKYDSELKHIHLKGGYNYDVLNIENLHYDIKPFIDSLIIDNNLINNEINDFDFSILYDYVPEQPNKKIKEYLKNYCLSKDFNALFIIRSNNLFNSLNPLKTTYKYNFDYGILTMKGKKKQYVYYNNIDFLYYVLEDNRLTYPVMKRDLRLSFPLIPKKSSETVYDENDLTLNDSKNIKVDFLNELKKKIKANFDHIITKISKK
ncbi:hypothetical protein PG593_10875 [Riemerella anatipestifer]|nr:hypothetical protein [Riemerella anatipestifer]